MNRVALKGLAARPVRTALTTLAIVLGVAMVSGAFTLTDTMRGAADACRRPPTTAPTRSSPAGPRSTSTATDWTAKRRRSTPPCSRRSARCRRSAVAVGDITDETPRSSAATASRSATARTSASATTPSAGRRGSYPFRLGPAAGPPARARS